MSTCLGPWLDQAAELGRGREVVPSLAQVPSRWGCQRGPEVWAAQKANTVRCHTCPQPPLSLELTGSADLHPLSHKSKTHPTPCPITKAAKGLPSQCGGALYQGNRTKPLGLGHREGVKLKTRKDSVVFHTIRTCITHPLALSPQKKHPHSNPCYPWTVTLSRNMGFTDATVTLKRRSSSIYNGLKVQWGTCIRKERENWDRNTERTRPREDRQRQRVAYTSQGVPRVVVTTASGQKGRQQILLHSIQRQPTSLIIWTWTPQ